MDSWPVKPKIFILSTKNICWLLWFFLLACKSSVSDITNPTKGLSGSSLCRPLLLKPWLLRESLGSFKHPDAEAALQTHGIRVPWGWSLSWALPEGPQVTLPLWPLQTGGKQACGGGGSLKKKKSDFMSLGIPNLGCNYLWIISPRIHVLYFLCLWCSNVSAAL